MSNRKPKPEAEAEPRFVNLGPSEAELRWINEQASAAGKSMLTSEEFLILSNAYRRLPLGARPVPADCRRPIVLSIAEAADFLIVDGKTDRFRERFIDSGELAADRLSRERWRFDRDELEALRERLSRGLM